MKHELPSMPIRAKSFEHQVRTFEFVMEKFGLSDSKQQEPVNTATKEGGGNDEHFQ